MLPATPVERNIVNTFGVARRDARIRFLKAQVEILRRKLGGNRVIPSPDDRARLLAIGQELSHNVADVIGIVTPQTYCRWVEGLREGPIAPLPRNTAPPGRGGMIAVRHVGKLHCRCTRAA